MEKIYGEYQGNIENRQKIKQLDEVGLWLEIDALAGYISLLHYHMAKGDFKDLSVSEDEYALEYLMYQTTNFGVDLNLPTEENKHLEISDSYKAWYSFYADYFKNELSNEEYKKFLKLRDNGSDTSDYVPEGNWKDKSKQLVRRAH